MSRGAPPERIAFVAFTRKAALEARERAQVQFGLSEDSLPYFRTLHSLAFRELGIQREQVMSVADYRAIGDALGVTFSVASDMLEGPGGNTKGDRLRFLEGYARTRCVPLRETWDELNGVSSWWDLDQYARTVSRYKQQTDKVDFTDLLEYGVDESAPVPIDVAIVDEAQDLSPLQWRYARHALSRASRLYVAGDDDQAIHRWAGADAREFMTLQGDREVLTQSYRLPASVYRLARSVVRRIGARVSKAYVPTGSEGRVVHAASVDELELGEGTWYLLARNTYLLRTFVRRLRLLGIPYTTRAGSAIVPAHIEAIKCWERLRRGSQLEGKEVNRALRWTDVSWRISEEKSYTLADLGLPPVLWHEALQRIPLDDREFYLAARRRGERLLDPPRVHVSTVHGVKGGEADNVALLLDVTHRSYMAQRIDPDAEHRVFFVGVTRARDRLYLLRPRSPHHYRL